MFSRLCVALAVLGLLVVPAEAARSKAKAKKPVVRKVVKKVPKTPAKTPAKATSASVTKGDLEPTVAFKHEGGKTPDPNATKTKEPEPKTDVTAKVPGDTDDTTYSLTPQQQEEAEKAGKAKMAKDPKGALEDFKKVVGSNPDYKFAGDVWLNMYNLSQRTGTDLLDQIRFAGKAGQAFGKGLSRQGVDRRAESRYNGIADQLINKWIDTEMKKIMSEQYK
ncbi:MAG TPA: hypothetical protein VGN26_07455 [Armatimonadota bacterium]|jgi:hypothetical protein